MGKKEEIICYMIPGLGASANIFNNLEFPPEIKPVPIHWAPHSPDQTLPNYAKTLLPQIDLSKQHILVGSSFGGVLAVELAKWSKPILTVLVSSVPTAHGIPPYLRWATKLGGSRLAVLSPGVPISAIRLALKVIFGPLNKEALDILVAEVSLLKPKFVQWAIGAMMQWDNLEQPAEVLHIHGSSDRIFPTAFLSPDAVISGAGHFAIYTHADQVSTIITSSVMKVFGDQ